MTTIFLRILLICFLINSAFAQTAESKKTYDDIKLTLGIVPSFLKEFPELGIEGAWQDMKGIQLNPQTSIPGKYKELIGLAVAAQIPCKYCVYFHKKAVTLNQGTPKEMREAIAMAASVRRGSAVLYGSQIDLAQFKSEVDMMFPVRSQQAMQEKPQKETPVLKTPDDAYSDMKNTFGFVPSFFKNYPQSGVVGWWKEMKGIEANPQSVIPGKYKDLIGLAVASQVPCQYCVYYHTKSALQNGASKDEINEAIAMAGITRQWSTVLNGSNISDKKFQTETDQIMNYLQKKEKKVTDL
jgi:AhpD family alkylhydroperoxidase